MVWPSPGERERLERFPVEVALEDLRGSFTLRAGDRDLVFSQHGPARLGVAVVLCAQRFMGFVPDDLASIPEHALVWVCDQLEAAPADLLAYGRRPQTRSEDLAAVRSHLGFRVAGERELDGLARWLVTRAVEYDAPSALFSLTAEHLLARRIARPSVDQLARLIATAREAAHHAGWRTADRKLERLRKETPTVTRPRSRGSASACRGSCSMPTAPVRGRSTSQTSSVRSGLAKLRAAVESDEKLAAPAEASRNDELHKQISWLQKTAGRIIRAVPLCAHEPDRGPRAGAPQTARNPRAQRTSSLDGLIPASSRDVTKRPNRG